MCAVLGQAQFRALALLICVLLGRPILFYGGALLHPKVSDVRPHELALVAADDDDDDDGSLEDVMSGDPLVPVQVAAFAAPDLHATIPAAPPPRILPHRGDPTDHPPRQA